MSHQILSFFSKPLNYTSIPTNLHKPSKIVKKQIFTNIPLILCFKFQNDSSFHRANYSHPDTFPLPTLICAYSILNQIFSLYHTPNLVYINNPQENTTQPSIMCFPKLGLLQILRLERICQQYSLIVKDQWQI